MIPPTPPSSTPTGQTFTHFAYIPDLGANILYICIFGFYLLAQVALGIKFRTWDYMGAMLCGVLLEVAGYAARIFMRKDPQERTPFLMDNICLILGPAFLAASIYLCMGRIVVVYGKEISRLSVSEQDFPSYFYIRMQRTKLFVLQAAEHSHHLHLLRSHESHPPGRGGRYILHEPASGSNTNGNQCYYRWTRYASYLAFNVHWSGSGIRIPGLQWKL